MIKYEYIALIISVGAIFINVYIAWKNRKYAFAKEEYFKLQQISEKVIAKLLLLENDFEKLKLSFEGYCEADKMKRLVIDNNNFNKADFEKDGEEIASFLEIYFPNVKKEWNLCLDCMGKIATIIFRIRKKTELKKEIDWQKEGIKFNDASRKLGDKPVQIAKVIMNELKKFKKKNLS